MQCGSCWLGDEDSLCYSRRPLSVRFLGFVLYRQPLSELGVMNRIRIANQDTGNSTSPTVIWNRFLQCIPGISAVKAGEIVRHYPTLSSLLHAYASCKDEESKRDLLSVFSCCFV